jgi:hypothetical protein
VFTEPSDQSPWIYQKYLLGKHSLPVRLEKVVQIPHKGGSILQLLFNQPVKCLDTDLIECSFEATFDFEIRSYVQGVWLSHNNSGTVRLQAGAFGGRQFGLHSSLILIQVGRTEEPIFLDFDQQESTDGANHDPMTDMWEHELEQMLELYELEPSSKWVMLCLLQLYQHLGKPCSESVSILDNLIQIDPDRKGYYQDTSK